MKLLLFWSLLLFTLLWSSANSFLFEHPESYEISEEEPASSSPTPCTVQWISTTALKVEWCGVSGNSQGPYLGEVECSKFGTHCSQAFSGKAGGCEHTVHGLCGGHCNIRMTRPDNYHCIGSTEIGTPSMPRNLRSSSTGGTTITIEWDLPDFPNGAVDGYLVTVQTTNPVGFYKFERTKERRFELSSLNPGSKYIITVQAFNIEPKNSEAELKGPTSTAITVSTTLEGSETVRGLRVVNVNSTQASFKWDRGESLVESSLYYINLYKSDREMRECIKNLEHVETYETNRTELELKGLLPYTCYHLGVTAPTVEGTNQIAVLISFKTKIGRPTAPDNLQATQITDTSIEIEWQVPREANGYLDGYIVEYETHGQFKDSFRGETVHCRFRAEALKPWTNYTFTVQAFNVDSEDENARIVGESSELTLQTQISVPSTPRNLTLLHLNSTYASLSWLPPTPVVGETWYRVMLFKTNKEKGQCNSALENVAMHDTFETEKNYDDLVPNSCYYVIVSALTEKGSSTNSVVTTFVTQAYDGLPSPHQMLKRSFQQKYQY